MSAKTEGDDKRVLHWETLLNIPNAPCPRSSHQISSLQSHIFLFGGENGPEASHFGYGIPVESTAVHCLDLDQPDKGWIEIPVTKGSPPSARLGHGQSIIVDVDAEKKDKHKQQGGGASLYVFGGRQPVVSGNLENIRSLNDLYRFDIESGVWEKINGTGEVPSPRSYHQMVGVDHTLFVFAGMIDDNRYNDLYAFDTKKQHWSRLSQSPMIEGRGGPGLCVIGDGLEEASLIVVAGFCGRPMADVWQYRIATDEWSPRTDWTLPVARSIFACGTLKSDPAGENVEICMFGGELENYDAALIEQGQDPTLQASMYTNETLLLLQSNSNGGSSSSSIRVIDPAARNSSPVARGWTAGCNASVKGKQCFVVFGGVRQGYDGEPSGVRLGDLLVLRTQMSR